MARVVKDESEEFEVEVGKAVKSGAIASATTDPFSNEVKTARDVSGLNDKLRKRVSRGGAKSTKIDKGVDSITGYNLFDVVQPPYNLDYLAQLMTVSEPHYAAVQAKVANIVGLGFDFINSHKTRLKIDNASGDEKKLNRIHRNITSMKNELFDLIDTFNKTDEFAEVLRAVYTDYESTGNGYFEIGRTSSRENWLHWSHSVTNNAYPS